MATPDDAPLYEIDAGTPEEAAPPTRTPDEAAGAEEVAAERQLHDAYLGAIEHMRAAPMSRHRVDIEGLIIAGLCGQGLSAILRIGDWTSGIVLGMLVAVASLLAAGYAWKRARLPAELLEALPLPLDGDPPSRAGAMDGAQRAISRRRRGEELARIATAADDLARCRPRLRLAAWGALAGTVCGWLCGAVGPAGAGVLAASAAAGAGAGAGWLAPVAPWPAPRLVQLSTGAIPAIAAVMALLCGAAVWTALGGCVVAVAAGLVWRQRLAALLAG